ncbi:TPA: phenylalanine--tRNA ligase subunit alpha [Candidatus Kaiserbacteria bacterium]|nr:MAG: Phenylalanine-tRNA ligase alpha subunit [Parcubacteria group bacterium GW2011_GWA1_56_13]KKW45350.1 MAG: Phenylalanine-tRNA ligase alpha subunit [Parcubacteria group bacterium GW2011_GWB1_57_6]HCR52351.1 phenylalanine--tRNA ligase subunit alpha [Candidatus Kaiserbacteria bacterium]
MKQLGRLHPITIAVREMADIFGRMGFGVVQGPELETEWYNFDALNIPGDHPSRDMWDTFWIHTKEGEERKVLRTHTSPVQIRWLEKHGAPTRIIVPGKVFRNEATDATHEAQFYQLEGLVVDTAVTLAHLKGTLDRFCREYFGNDAKIRLRPSFFPFTEPSVEVDVWFPVEQKWLEVMGAGMVHPKVLRNADIDATKYQGFAFGLGVERFIMIKYGIPDVRLFHSGDIRLNYAFDEKPL